MSEFFSFSLIFSFFSSFSTQVEHPHFLSNGGNCDGVYHQLGMAEYSAAQAWLLWEDLVNSRVRAALLEGQQTMLSLNGPIRNMAERLGIVVPSITTMQNQGRFQAQWPDSEPVHEPALGHLRYRLKDVPPKSGNVSVGRDGCDPRQHCHTF